MKRISGTKELVFLGYLKMKSRITNVYKEDDWKRMMRIMNRLLRRAHIREKMPKPKSPLLWAFNKCIISLLQSLALALLLMFIIVDISALYMPNKRLLSLIRFRFVWNVHSNFLAASSTPKNHSTIRNTYTYIVYTILYTYPILSYPIPYYTNTLYERI